MEEIIVVGAGVSGLSSAIRLLEAGWDVKVISREHPQATTSAVAAAIWSGHGENPRHQRWARMSLDVFREMTKDENTGVVMARFRDIYPHPIAEPWYRGDLEFCEQIPPDELPDGYVDGYIMEIPLIQSPVYLEYLLSRFDALGGIIEYREVENLIDLYDSTSLIINCSGAWARYLADDEGVYPLWGQVLLVDAPHITELLMDDVAFTYIFPRRDGCILGGVSIRDRWSREVDENITEDILSRCEVLQPGIRDARVLDQRVGLRPGRDEVRLEVEQVQEGCSVIHNYGHGPVGFTLSWGCADDVLALVKDVLSE